MIKYLENACNMARIILLCLVFVYTSNGDVCVSNDVIQCNISTYSTDCTIYQNNTETISQAISLCSTGSISRLKIYFDRGLQANITTITLNLANNIGFIGIYSYSPSLRQPVNLIASQSHPYVTSMYLRYLYIYNSENLFDDFPNLVYIVVHSSYNNASPKFSKLKKLTYLATYSNGLSNITIDKEWVGGLSRLRYLTFSRCGIQNITTDAFENLNSLTYLNLGSNALLELKPDVFRNLTELRKLYLHYNKYDIRIAEDINNQNAFSPLKKLTLLYLYNTKIIPLDAFLIIKSLNSLTIGYYDFSRKTVDKEWVLGGLSKLRTLSLSNCDIQNITTDAFWNLISLTSLNLGANDLLELTPNAFRNLTELRKLYLYFNRYDIRIFKDINHQNAFSPLKKLTYLDLFYTTIIPFDAFSTLSSIQSIDLPRTSTGIVPSTPFQNLHKLTFLSFFEISLICNCSMQWASIVPKFGINIQYGSCSDSGKEVTEASQYTACGLTESYQCFNKSISCNQTCNNTLDSYMCIACDEGYLSSQGACYDIDECMNISYCEQKCRNTLGSYQCYCDSGYKLSDDLISCTEIDKCSNSSLNTCEQHQCLNEMGSYKCICNPGYYLSGDGFSCKDMENCNDTNNQQIYSNGFGVYSCRCKENYELSVNGTSCEDINECNEISLNSCGIHQCVNEKGSYRCICDNGFKLAVNNISCHDIDECIIANNNCHPHECLNLVGFYTCSCGEGYNLTTNATTCEDIDECSLVSENSCGSHQCVNEQGSYRCVCDEGFQLAVNNISCHGTAFNSSLVFSQSSSSSAIAYSTSPTQSSSSLVTSELTSLISKFISVNILLVVIIFASILLNFSLLFVIIYMRNQRKKMVKSKTNCISKSVDTEDIEMDTAIKNSRQNQQNFEISSRQLLENSTMNEQIIKGIQVNNIQEAIYENLTDLPQTSYHNPLFDETNNS